MQNEIFSDRTPDLSAYRQQFIEDLETLIRIPSVKASPQPNAPFGAETVRALEAFLDIAGRMGFRTQNLDGYAGFAEWGPEQSTMIGAVGHLDVVPPADWAEAFVPIMNGDTMTGRGTIDDKGPILAALYAVKYLMDQGYRPQHRIRLIVGLDEESGSECMVHYNRVAEAPIAAFTPDADFPVIAAEKGILQIKVSVPYDPHKTAPDGTRLIELSGGTRANVIPGAAQLVLQNPDGSITKCRINGRAGHASMPAEGQNAIALAMAELSAMGLANEAVDCFNSLIGMDHNGSRIGMQCSDEASGHLTLNVGLAAVKDGRSEWVLDIRHPVTADYEPLLAEASRLLKPWGGTLTVLHYSPPLNLAADHPLVRTLMSVYNDLTGLAAKPVGIGGGTYARSIPNTVAFGPVFPGQIALMHQTGESADIGQLLASAGLYAEAFRRLDQIMTN